MTWLKMAADTHINLSNRLRIVSMVSAVMSYISSNSSQNSDSIGEDKAMDSVVRLLASRVKAHESYVVYLNLRVEQMSNVILALLTHEDASISADMAKSNHELAEHAKRDSSAMKTITDITMAFLPGTFFATSFTLPTSDWKGETLISNTLWVYWVFTLPTTALAFLSWLALANNAQVIGAMLSQLRGGRRKED
ncbi:hypothetical protein F4824DRAFT_453559 [Ustulina deusta]|nr:hypothetical protein F4824DRAFT_453559 [Ustulina deusta]